MGDALLSTTTVRMVLKAWLFQNLVHASSCRWRDRVAVIGGRDRCNLDGQCRQAQKFKLTRSLGGPNGATVQGESASENRTDPIYKEVGHAQGG